jgi:YfiH family protein
MSSEWREIRRGGLLVFEPFSPPSGVLVAFSSRGIAPAGMSSPTEYLARRFADALGLDGTPVFRATQVHGRKASIQREAPEEGSVRDAGECDILATPLPDVALAVQTADCVPILLAGRTAVGTVHAGWRGTAQGAASAGTAALAELGEDPSDLHAWLGPSIGPCCYEVGPEVANEFAEEFVRQGNAGRSHLDLRAANRAQLLASGVSASRIRTHPACTRCGGDQFASYRRDGAGSGRMIGLIARLSPR